MPGLNMGTVSPGSRYLAYVGTPAGTHCRGRPGGIWSTGTVAVRGADGRGVKFGRLVVLLDVLDVVAGAVDEKLAAGDVHTEVGWE